MLYVNVNCIGAQYCRTDVQKCLTIVGIFESTYVQKCTNVAITSQWLNLLHNVGVGALTAFGNMPTVGSGLGSGRLSFSKLFQWHIRTGKFPRLGFISRISGGCRARHKKIASLLNKIGLDLDRPGGKR